MPAAVPISADALLQPPAAKRRRRRRTLPKVVREACEEELAQGHGIRPARGVRVHNMVILARIRMQVHPEMAAISLGGRHDADLFTAWVVHPFNTRATMSVFNNGKVVVTGTRTEQDAWVSVQMLAYAIQTRFLIPARVQSLKVQNVVGSAWLGYALDLYALEASARHCMEYEPGNFPGLQYRYHADEERWGDAFIGKKRQISLVIFDMGTVVLTGLRSYEQMVQVFDQVSPMLANFRK